MKLLFVLSEYLPDSGGGIITFYANLLPRLAARGHQVKVFVASHSSMDRAARVEDGVEVEYLRSSFAEAARAGCKKFRNDAFWAFLPLAWGAFHQVKGGEGFDIVEATDWGLLFMPWVVSERKAKVVVSLHGSNGQVDWFSHPEPRGFDGDVVRLAEVSAIRLADAIHANSRANAEFWREKTGREIQVIPPVYAGRDAADGGGLLAESGENKSYLTTIEGQGGRENRKLGKAEGRATESWRQRGAASGTMQVIEQPKVGPKGEAVGTTESKHTRSKEMEAGTRLAGQDGASEPDSLASELADSSVSESPIRSSDAAASSPATSYTLPVTGLGVSSLDPRRSTLDAPGLVVGRLQNWKGAELLCQALRLAPGIEIEWAGGDTDWGSTGLKASEYLARNYPDVFGSQLRWLGRLARQQVMEKMQLAGFLVVPSLWDVFNLTAAEGMEAGLPVICSKAAGAEMLIENGRSGFLFDLVKAEELGDLFKLVAGMSEAERRQIGADAQEAVKTHLNEEKILNLLELSYGNAIKLGVRTRKNDWLEALLSAGPVQVAPPNLNLVQRAIRKAARMLVNV